MEKVLIAGDWHGNVQWSTAAASAAGRAGFKSIYQVGDFPQRYFDERFD